MISRALKAIEGARNASDLIPYLGANKGVVDMACIRRLRRIGKPALPYLLDVLQTGSYKQRESAIAAMALIGIENLDSAVPGARAIVEQAVNGMTNMGFHLLGNMLRLEDDASRAVVTRFIAAMKVKDAAIISYVGEGLKNRDPAVRDKTVEILAGAGEPALRWVQNELRSGNKALTVEAIRVLPRLQIAPARVDPEVMDSALVFFSQATAESRIFVQWLGLDAARWLAWRCVNGDRWTAESASRILAGMGSSAAEAAPILIEFLDDSEDEVRERCATALVSMGEAATPALVQMARTQDVKKRVIAIRVLVRAGLCSSEQISELSVATLIGHK
jgi:HEAT repeat protein